MSVNNFGDIADNMHQSMADTMGAMVSVMTGVFTVIGFMLIVIAIMKFARASQRGESIGPIFTQLLTGVILLSAPGMLKTLNEAAFSEALTAKNERGNGYQEQRLAQVEKAKADDRAKLAAIGVMGDVLNDAQLSKDPNEVNLVDPFATAMISGLADAMSEDLSRTTDAFGNTTLGKSLTPNEADNSLEVPLIQEGQAPTQSLSGKPAWHELALGSIFASGIYEYTVTTVGELSIVTENQFGEQVTITKKEYETL